MLLLEAITLLLKYETNLQPFARLAKHGLKHYAGANNNSK